MLLPWVVAALAMASAAVPGSSLRGAVEALQRRQRAQNRPVAPVDYEQLYEFIPPGYPDSEYPDIEDLEVEPNPNYIVKFLEENERPTDYEYKIVKKKSSRLEPVPKKESAFRERSHHGGNDRLRDLFENRNEDDKNEITHERAENDAEYALLLSQLWAKYKNNKGHENREIAPPGIVKLYKEKVVKKRYPDNWGPIAFKRKRSSDPDTPILSDYQPETKQTPVSSDPNYNTYDVSDDGKNDDWREEYSIAFQPLDDNSESLGEENQYFPVSKRSSPYLNNQKKRFAQNLNKHDKSKAFRSSSGTDPRIIKDLSKIFGDVEIKAPVKRNANKDEIIHEPKPPQITLMGHNASHEHNSSHPNGNDVHEQHEHLMHHPGLSGKAEHSQDPHNQGVHNHDGHNHHIQEKPITVRKKSIDWSDYFGIDKRGKKIFHNVDDNRMKRQYLNTFNKEVIYPLNSFHGHSAVKRNYVQPNLNEETVIQNKDKRSSATDDTNKNLDNLDKNLRNVESLIVDEALHYSDGEEQLDSKEEQEMKEKMLQKLAAAYSLEKMRKALKEFKQSLQPQKSDALESSPVPFEEAKDKRVAVKKELRDNEIPPLNKDDDFEEEQGAGHYLNGKIEPLFSEGYMGGSGRHRVPVISTVGAAGACPMLEKIVERCRGVDLLAGDRGQLFLPLCSLHQICYLCGEAPSTSCDLAFLSEADTTCEGDMGCQRAARSALMALRELHDNLADEMDGECEASPCLPATLKLNIGWQRALQQ